MRDEGRNPEISVISTVRLYFKSPVAKDKKKVDQARKRRRGSGD
jgi:hypothetical protein